MEKLEYVLLKQIFERNLSKMLRLSKFANDLDKGCIIEIQALNQTILNKDNLPSFQTRYGVAKSHIQNQLSYKLGQAMIANSKSLLGYIRMPFVLSYIKDKHKHEQKIYQEKIKKRSFFKLPPLEGYPDYIKKH